MEKRTSSVAGHLRPTVILIMMSCFLVPAAAVGQGFGIYEHGACAMARGAAGVAAPCDDGSAIYVNPAGLVGHEGVTLGSGGMLVFGSGGFTSDAGTRLTSTAGSRWFPTATSSYGVNPRLAFGVGLYAPYGLGVKWPLDFDGRFVSYDSTLKTIYVQPTAAYAINDRVSVGIGLTVRAELRRVEPSRGPGSDSAGCVWTILRCPRRRPYRLREHRAVGVWRHGSRRQCGRPGQGERAPARGRALHDTRQALVRR